MQDDKEGEIMTLAKRIQWLLEKYLLETPAIANVYMEEVAKIRTTITGYGYLVQWSAALDTQLGRVKVEVQLFKPKPNMTPEEQQLYDTWFLEANKMKKPRET